MKTYVTGEHLSAPAVEEFAVSDEVRHLLACQRCAAMILRYAEERQKVPFDQYPAAE